MIGNTVKKIRKQWGMTQTQFAIALGVPDTKIISRWENGKVAVPALDDQLIKILDKRIRKKNKSSSGEKP